MANERTTGASSGNAGGTDTEPLRGGMDEVERREQGRAPERPSYAGQQDERETAARKDPPSPYHDVHVSDGGLSPRAMPGEGTTPPRPSGEIEDTAGEKIAQERGELENEASNVRRTDPAGRGRGVKG